MAVIHTEPTDGPIHRAENPEDWVWYTPHFNHLQTIVEVLMTGNVLQGNQSGAKSSQLPERAKRPWDKSQSQEVKEFKFEPTPLDVLDDWLNARMS